MVGLVERRLSKSAVWCRRLAIFAVPYFLITIVMHRIGNITADQAIGILAVGFIILVLSILLAIRAMVQLWNHGAKGGRLMISGLFLSCLMLAPFVLFAFRAIQYPAINDISTNVYALPLYSQKTMDIREERGVSKINALPETYDDDTITDIVVNYPKVNPRRYPAGPDRVYRAVKEIVADRGWSVTDIRGLSDVETEGKENTANTTASEQLDGGLETASIKDIYMDAVSSSLIFAFKNDVLIMIVEENENTLVEMRSAARWGIHDFGVNAQIIREFLADLDQSLLGIAGEG